MSDLHDTGFRFQFDVPLERSIWLTVADDRTGDRLIAQVTVQKVGIDSDGFAEALGRPANSASGAGGIGGFKP
ncbi:MAG: hypothetical protein FJY92_08680 [Candidatus Hydrogenedentes bacterium]|nr:hypothetical protein [Candidatus Hydrogenedentota bacterium]